MFYEALKQKVISHLDFSLRSFWFLCSLLYIYIYIYIERERDRQIDEKYLSIYQSIYTPPYE